MIPKSLPKILYIDDTPDARMLVSRLLSLDYIVLEASDPLNGIELAIDTQPDLILVDVNLPQLSGHEVATRLRTLLPDTPLVAFTADATPGARERALAAGCVGYLTKPLNVDTFADQIAEFLRGRREVIAGDSTRYTQAYQAELVERLEAKVRELSKTAGRNAYLNEQNERMVAMLQRRQRLLEAGARVSHSITSILDLDELLQATVDIICEEFGLYHAAIYLTDVSGEWAKLRAGHGQAGAAMLAEGHRLAVDNSSIVGAAIRERAARIAFDAEGGQARSTSPYLLDAQSEMALPLIVKDAVFGALSVQSDQPAAFGEEDTTALQSLADQIAIAIKNAQLLRELADANRELLRSKTFEAIATATGEAIHWVGNKAAPVPGSARRVRDDLAQLLAVFQAVLAEPPATRPQHPLWPVVQTAFDVAAQQGLDLPALAREASTFDPKRLQTLGGLDSILEDLSIIEHSAATILSIKEDMIGPARKQNMATIRLADLLNETIGVMGLPDGVVRVEFAPDAPDISGDARQLNQVFNNLIKNAWEALHHREQPRINVSARRADDGQSAIVQVRDNGPGIPPDLLDRIWVSFFTTKGDRGGTGLGLSACAGIVGQHGGKIWVDSQPGQGATFSVLLPAA